ncbi:MULTISPECIES: hypothetical protein [Clostridia]|jgi:hypothetical protein|uniref:hypothetical protein n=1 Tax=Clostridia TaxID=186801 RepID=UPI000E539B25|nr:MULTISPECIES: hypothetical protein [Clostridia]RHV67441.1 hypothetical protein DXB15_12150 [Roseburia sp. OM02-15]
MASLIFWFIVLIFIISSVVKGKKKPANRNRNAGTTQSCPVQKPRTQPTAAQTVKKQQTSYGSYKQSKAKPAASTTKYSDTKKAKASEQRAQQQQQAEQMSIFDQNEIVAAAKANTREVELDNDRDAENQNLMDDVYEVMVKGPKNNIEFQRDFIAEGMDMLNSFNV